MSALLLFALVSCGDAGTFAIDYEGPLTGVWENDDQTIIVYSNTISVYWSPEEDPTSSDDSLLWIYWYGNMEQPSSESDTMSWESYLEVDETMTTIGLADSDELEFSYDNGVLSYRYKNISYDFGNCPYEENETVTFEKISDNGNDVSLRTISNIMKVGSMNAYKYEEENRDSSVLTLTDQFEDFVNETVDSIGESLGYEYSCDVVIDDNYAITTWTFPTLPYAEFIWVANQTTSYANAIHDALSDFALEINEQLDEQLLSKYTNNHSDTWKSFVVIQNEKSEDYALAIAYDDEILYNACEEIEYTDNELEEKSNEKQLDIQFEDFSCEPDRMLIDRTELLTFTVKVISDDFIEYGDIVVYDSDNDRTGFMNDSGEDGDEEAGDGIWTLRCTCTTHNEGTITYHAQAGNIMSNDAVFTCYKSSSMSDFVIERLDPIRESNCNDDGYIEDLDKCMDEMSTELDNMEREGLIDSYYPNEEEYQFFIYTSTSSSFTYDIIIGNKVG